MESDEEYNNRYQHEINGKPIIVILSKIKKARFIKMVKAGEVPGWEWVNDDSDWARCTVENQESLITSLPF